MIIVTRLYHKKIPRSETRATQDVASLIRQSKKIPSDQGTSIIIIPPLKENARKLLADALQVGEIPRSSDILKV